MDQRVELSLINKHVRQRNRESGETVTWFEFAPFSGSASAGSLYDDVYDEGAPGPAGRSYRQGVTIPTVYVAEVEDRFTAQEDGRQPTQNISVTFLYSDAVRSGLTHPEEYQGHLNDVFYYDNRYYKVHDYHVRGRLPSEVVIGVQGYEVYLEQEFVFDNLPVLPSVLPWPSSLPTPS